MSFKYFLSALLGLIVMEQAIASTEESQLSGPARGKQAALAEMRAQNQRQEALPDEDQMNPVLPEQKNFIFGTASSNSVTPLVLSMLDRTFFEQTKAANQKERDERNTGTILLNLLVREVLFNTPNAEKILHTDEKRDLAKQILLGYLERHRKEFAGFKAYYEQQGSLNVDQVSALNDKIKFEILNQVSVTKKGKVQIREDYEERPGQPAIALRESPVKSWWKIW